jgi:hypothetical protein
MTEVEYVSRELKGRNSEVRHLHQERSPAEESLTVLREGRFGLSEEGKKGPPMWQE